MYPIQLRGSFKRITLNCYRRLVVIATLAVVWAFAQSAAADLAWTFNPGAGMAANVDVTATYQFPQQMTDVQFAYIPGFAIGPDVYDFGNAAQTESTLSAPGWALAASGVSAVAIRGLGSPAVEVYFRVSTLGDASFPPAPTPYGTDSNALLNAFLPFEITGSPPDTSYHVQCNYEYFATAATIAEQTFDDRARTTGAVFVGNGVGGNWVPFYGAFDSQSVPPFETGGTLTGSIGVIAGSSTPGQLPLLSVQLSEEAHSLMTWPGIGNDLNEDLCGSEFYGRATFTIVGICNRPSIALQPVNTLACASGSATFTVAAGGGGGPYTYQWQYNAGGQNWTNQDDGPFYGGGVAVVSGAATATLTVSNVDIAAATGFRCVVSNACGPTNSNAASLSMVLVLPGDARVDFQRNGRDIQAFVNVLLAGAYGPASPPRCASDINHDGAVDALDVPLLVGLLMGP